ncbi:hypothetical protein LZ31DRAFT_178119 [Colletotrichum somersetense]|nr:hypothetical protein LZ31DRAFT_178119 [Colletotrichum somersetense]
MHALSIFHCGGTRGMTPTSLLWSMDGLRPWCRNTWFDYPRRHASGGVGSAFLVSEHDGIRPHLSDIVAFFHPNWLKRLARQPVPTIIDFDLHQVASIDMPNSSTMPFGFVLGIFSLEIPTHTAPPSCVSPRRMDPRLVGLCTSDTCPFRVVFIISHLHATHWRTL